ncbi:MAG: ATP-dependent DNA helicase RecG [Nitrospiraceae bacterium]
MPSLSGNAPSTHAESLLSFVRRVTRPIEFARRDGYAHLITLKNLGRFISSQVITELAERTYPPKIEADLLTLRQLFIDFHPGLPPDQQKRRLEGARDILLRLSATGFEGQGRETRGYRENSYPSPRVSGLKPAAELWNLPIQFAKGVGPKRTALLAKLGMHTVEDALWNVPWRYEDRAVITEIGRLTLDSQGTICGVIVRNTLKRLPHRRMTVLDVTVEDNTGRLRAAFFNQPYLEEILVAGARVMLSGRVHLGPQRLTDLRMDVAHYEVLGDEGETSLHVGRIVPIYHETKGWTSRQMRVLIKTLLDEHAGALTELLPVQLRARYRFPPIQRALTEVHFPDSNANMHDLEQGLTPAHRRLAFEEFFILQLALALRQRTVKEEVKGIRFDPDTPLLKCLRTLLPFKLTSAQDAVLTEIQRDMAAPRPMHRLLQGDVGCGKTIVALHALVLACGSGYQGALMVPTEILAEQHFLNLRPLLQALGLTIVLLKSDGRKTARAAILKQVESGEADVIIGTHALIQKGVRFAKLGLAVIDEQHRFGVLQRKTLIDKGYHPDVLVLTATPIPRTLAMTVYGDLDISVIKTLPPGRKPIRTGVFAESQRRRAYRILQDEIQAGRQGYIVYPLVEESEKVDLRAAIQAAGRLQANEFRSARVGLLHGRMKTLEKERTMASFKAGDIQILVTTTVVEVGVDVPNATVMLVEHAERFGLAQLHQLRGRVGRGLQSSYCLLLTAGGEVEYPRATGRATQNQSDRRSSKKRLEAMVKSGDGFVIAEEDLRIRGPGEFFGLRQWGMPEFRVANLIRDGDLLEQARREAFALAEHDPLLHAPHNQGLYAAMRRRWERKLDLGSVS